MLDKGLSGRLRVEGELGRKNIYHCISYRHVTKRQRARE